MAFSIAIALVVMPLVEIGVFIEIGGWLGLWPTLAVIVLTAASGAVVLRHQGLATLGRARHSLRQGRAPLAEMFEGLCLFAAGLLLFTPGFVTDALGGLLLMPPVRRALRRAVASRLVAASGPAPPPGGDPAIDGEYRDITPEDLPK